MAYFGQLEIITLIVLSVGYAVMIPVHALTLHLRRFAPLRDIQPIACMLAHLGGVAYNMHLFFAWRHDSELCSLLAVLQYLASSTFFCTMTAKHFLLHKRYATLMQSNTPVWIVWLLCSVPFFVLGTYRFAAHENSSDGRCPNVDGLVALFGSLLVIFTVLRLVLVEHPSSHYRRAVVVEILGMLLCAGASVARQFTSNDTAMFICNILLCFTINAIFMAYAFPPILLRLRKGNEFDDEAERLMMNDSVFGSPTNGEDKPDTLMQRVVCKLSNVVSAGRFSRGNSDTSGSPNPSTGGWPTAQENSYGTDSRFTTATATSLHGSINTAHQSSTKFRSEVDRDVVTMIELINDCALERLEKFTARVGIQIVNSPDQSGRTPLHHAARRGDVSIIRFLMEVGADANRFDEKGRSPLHETVRCRDHQDRSSAITELVKGGAMVNLPTPLGLTPLHFAVMHGHLGALNTLLRYDANPMYNHDKEDRNMPWQEVHITQCQRGTDTSRKSPLMLATEANEDMCVSSMLYHLRTHATNSVGSTRHGGPPKFNVDLRCPHGLTLLHVALALGNSKVVSVLLNEAGSNTKIGYDDAGQNVFHLAALGDSDECVALLLTSFEVPDIVPSMDTLGSGEITPGNPGLSPVSHVPPAMALQTQSSGSGNLRPSSYSERSLGDGLSSRGLHMKNCTTYGLRSHPDSTAHMCFGVAVAKLREHVPQVSPTASTDFTNLEAAVDQATAKLRNRGQNREVDLLHRALLIVSKRIRLNSSRSLSNLYNSQPASLPQSSNVFNDKEATPMDRVREMLNQPDGNRLTPLHFAIAASNTDIVMVLGAYGARWVEDDESANATPDMWSPETQSAKNSMPSPASPLGGETDILADGFDLKKAVEEHRERSSQSASSSQQNRRSLPKCQSHTRFLRKNVDTAQVRKMIRGAYEEGRKLHHEFVSSSAEISPNEHHAFESSGSSRILGGPEGGSDPRFALSGTFESPQQLVQEDSTGSVERQLRE